MTHIKNGGVVPADVERVQSPQHRRVLERALERDDGEGCIVVHTLEPNASLPVPENLFTDNSVFIVARGLLETLPSSERSAVRSLAAG